MKAQAEANARKQAAALQWAQQGNDPALIGNILGQLLKGGWESQKRDYQNSVSAHEQDNTVPVKENLYSRTTNSINDLINRITGRRETTDKPTDPWVEAYLADTGHGYPDYVRQASMQAFGNYPPFFIEKKNVSGIPDAENEEINQAKKDAPLGGAYLDENGKWQVWRRQSNGNK